MLNLKKKQELILRIRKPDWADKVTFIINGKVEYPILDKDGYWVVNRTWAQKDKIILQLPMHVYVESLMGLTVMLLTIWSIRTCRAHGN